MRGFSLMVGLVALLGTSPALAQSRVVERIVAVVDDEPLLISQVRARAQPLLMRLRAANDGEVTAAAVAQTYQDVFEAMIEQRLLEREAKRRLLTVSAAELRSALAAVAKQSGISVEELLDMVRETTHLDAATYRAAVGEQVLVAKLLRQVAPNPPSDTNAQVAYMQQKRGELLRLLRKRFIVDVRVRFR